MECLSHVSGWLASQPAVRHVIVIMDVLNGFVAGVSVLGWQTKGTGSRPTTGTFFFLSVVCWIGKQDVTGSNPSRR